MLCFDHGNDRPDSCKIGEGDPVVCDGELQGLFSWNYKESTCDYNSRLGVYVKICIFTDWIRENIAT